MKDYQFTYQQFWKPIIEPNGFVDMDALMRELHDYHLVMGEVGKVYDHITGGKLSKPNTAAVAVISEAEASYHRHFCEQLKDVLDDSPLLPHAPPQRTA